MAERDICRNAGMDTLQKELCKRCWMNINKIENHSQIKTRMPQDLVFCGIRVFIDFLSISLTLSSLTKYNSNQN